MKLSSVTFQEYCKPIENYSFNSRQRTYYVVEKRDHHQRCLLRTLVCEHILTTNIQVGDTICAIIPVRITIDKFTWNSTQYEDCGIWCPRLQSVLGRAVSLGEDGAEDAFGHPVLPDVIFEKEYLHKEYSYVPVEMLKVEPQDEDEGWKTFDSVVKGKCAVSRWFFIRDSEGSTTRKYASLSELEVAEKPVSYETEQCIIFVTKDGLSGHVDFDWDFKVLAREEQDAPPNPQ